MSIFQKIWEKGSFGLNLQNFFDFLVSNFKIGIQAITKLNWICWIFMLSFATKWVNVFSTPSSYNKLKEMEQKQRFGPNLDSFLRHEKWTNVWFNFLNAYCFIMDYKKYSSFLTFSFTKKKKNIFTKTAYNLIKITCFLQNTFYRCGYYLSELWYQNFWLF